MNILMKPASGHCNMSCEYCFYCDEISHRTHSLRGMMEEQTLKNIIRRTLLVAREPVIYAYQGGEPLLRGKDFYTQALILQKKYNRSGVPVRNALQTNGTLLDDEWCAFFSKHHFLVGVSVDGTSLLHDKYRHMQDKSGSWRNVQEGIALLEKWKVDYNILTVVTEDIAANIEEVYQYYSGRGWHYQQYIACLEPEGEIAAQHRYSLQAATYGNFMIRLFHLWKADRAEGKEPYIRQFDNYLGILMGYQPESCEQMGRCGLQYAVEADGSVYPCDFYMTDPYLLGNFNNDRLQMIDARRGEIGFVQKSMKLPEKCLSCKYYRLCRGGCTRNRDAQAKNRFCESYLMFFDEVYEEMLEMAKGYGRAGSSGQAIAENRTDQLC